MLNTACSLFSTWTALGGILAGIYLIMTQFEMCIHIQPTLPKYYYACDVGNTAYHISKMDNGNLNWFSKKLVILLRELFRFGYP